MKMVIWTFFDYVSHVGNNQIDRWYEDLLIQEQSDFDEFLKTLGKTEKWGNRDYRPLHCKCIGLGELCFASCKKQHRVIGQFGPNHQYTLLIGCTHKQRVYDPPNAMDTALVRKKSLENRTGSLAKHDQ